MAGTYLAGDKTKAEILKGSKKLFYKNGYRQTTYNDISASININRALIPYHFKSKEALAFFVYNEIVDTAISSADELLDSSSFSEDLQAAFNIIVFYRLFNNKNFTGFVCELITDNINLFSDDSIDMHNLNIFKSAASKKAKVPDKIDAACLNAIRIKLIHSMRENSEHTDEIAGRYIRYALCALNIFDSDNELFDSAVQLADLIDINISSGFTVSVTYR